MHYGGKEKKDKGGEIVVITVYKRLVVRVHVGGKNRCLPKVLAIVLNYIKRPIRSLFEQG